jgi:hypothetical protein
VIFVKILVNLVAISSPHDTYEADMGIILDMSLALLLLLEEVISYMFVVKLNSCQTTYSNYPLL